MANLLENLTFGIELELVAAWPRQLYGEGPQFSAVQAIHPALLGAGVAVTSKEPGWEDRHDEFRHWGLKPDLIRLSPAETAAVPQNYAVESVELASRRFDFYRDDWRGEIKRVIDAVARLDNVGARFFTNSSTGLHVHVGNGDRDLPLRTAKNLMQLATAFERVIDTIHSTNRIAYPKIFRPEASTIGDFFHTPLSWFHLNNGKTQSGMLYDWLGSIELARSIEALNKICSVSEPVRREKGILERIYWGHNSSYNLDSLHLSDLGKIEFRQHAGTLDFLEILHWVMLTTSMIRYCSGAPVSAFLALCAHGIDGHFDLRDLLSAIECPADTVSYFARDEEDDETIGFLGNLLPLAAVADLDELIAHNDVESSDRLSDEALREAVVANKYYGYTSNVVHIPLEAIERYYTEAMYSVPHRFDKTSLLGSEDKELLARALVWHRLSRNYKGEEDDEEVHISSASRLDAWI
ncbi:hypothetical protein LTR10_001040 [Elasticomyces elasticus]|nr:hypothetical protein LTR10_001040 [Elasticomyces elasticus]KAK4979715.1 hypothetical protein LTR42_000020 [Elasticomyces elasticus]